MISRYLGLIRNLLPGAVVALIAAGCGTMDTPNAASFASVTILNHSVEEIRNTTTQVFREKGYSGGPVNSIDLVFEKEASRMTTLSREGVWATQQGASTIERVRAEIVDLGSKSIRLQCQAYYVNGAGDNVFEDEVPLAHMRSGPYRSLLDDVAKRLK